MRCPALCDLPPPPSGKTGWPWTEETPPLAGGAPLPKISVVTPNYNFGAFLEETIRSVLLQGYEDLEYLVIDAGSTDGSLEIIRRYEPWLRMWMSRPDRGQSDALNEGFSHSTGVVLSWLNSDDIWYPGTLQRVARVWRDAGGADFLAGDGEMVGPWSGARPMYVKAKNYTLRELLLYHYDKYLPQPSVFFSKRAFEEAGKLDHAFRYAMDLDFWLRLRTRYPLAYVPYCLSQLRQHDESKTFKHNVAATEEVNAVITRFLPRRGRLFAWYVRKGMRAALAASMCLEGLREYFAGRYAQALRLWGRAVCLSPAVLTRPVGYRLFVRLFLPRFVKQAILRSP